MRLFSCSGSESDTKEPGFDAEHARLQKLVTLVLCTGEAGVTEGTEGHEVTLSDSEIHILFFIDEKLLTYKEIHSILSPLKAPTRQSVKALK